MLDTGNHDPISGVACRDCDRRVTRPAMTLITIHLGAQIAPDAVPAIRAGLVDKLWEHGVPVEHVVIEIAACTASDWELM